ncbi:Ca2+-binding protein, RTX toxin-related [Sphingobium sp. AP50]|uniref:calcium-binding protein n=1 Tax=Sphingobium sp. AP50 TaxID=1884369 RepID=UPI0008C32FF7|nr:M10 family metallopeptidase C-terminal domain-containing protein [Sphingobium sp. AP50]SEK01726.1 Ca2+-binding protein, RTX toxin-related [Sphingobium sp. AP50]
MARINGSYFSDRLNGTADADEIYGYDGDDQINGLDGDDRIDGGNGSDRLTGGAGADIFVYHYRPINDFVTGDIDEDLITDFEVGVDRIDLSAYGISSLEIVQDRISQSGTDTLISIFQHGNEDRIRIQNVLPSQLDATSFIFSGVTTAQRIVGTMYGDLLFGGAGDDQMIGDDGDDDLRGDAGNDWIDGGRGDDILSGGAGADVFYYSLRPFGQDVITDFEVGVDKIDLSALGISNLAIFQDRISQSGSDTVISFLYAGAVEEIRLENVLPSQLTEDSFIFNSSTQSLYTNGGAGPNLLFGGMGNDRLSGSGELRGDAGNDDLRGDAGNDRLFGGTGNDRLSGGKGDDLLSGGAGLDIFSYDNNDYYGTKARLFGKDVITDFEVGADRINLSQLGISDLAMIQDRISQSGNDTVISFFYNGQEEEIRILNVLPSELTEASFIFSKVLDDQIVWGAEQADLLFGGLGNDSMSGLSGDDELRGGEGDDIFFGALGNNIFTGGTGADRFIFGGFSVGEDVITDFEVGVDKIDLSTIGLATLSLIEDRISQSGNDTLISTFFNGEERVLRILNVLPSELNADSFYLSSYTEPMTISGSVGADLLLGGVGNDVVSGYWGNDDLRGDTGDDRLNGGAGDDILYGGAGADLLDGGAGADRMIGGAGNDIYIVDTVDDVVIEAAGGGMDTVRTGHDIYTLPDNVEVLEVRDVYDANRIVLHGNASDNLISLTTLRASLQYGGPAAIYGEDGNDQLIGADSGNILDGGSGADYMVGGQASDVFIVDNVGDVVVELTNVGTRDHVMTGLSYTLGANVEFLTLTGSGNLRGTGNQLDNVITGNDGNNVLSGLLGDDTLNGMAGDDILIPDSGNNVIDGGTGNDLVILLGVKSSYSYLEGTQAPYDGFIYLVGEEGAVRLSGVEQVRFADGMLATADLKANLSAFDGLRYAAGYADVAKAFGTNAVEAANHYIRSGFAEGRDAKAFDPLDYIAGYSDLMAAFGTNAAAGIRHYLVAGRSEGRTDDKFSGLDYAASYPTLAAQFGANEEAAARHYIQTGRAQGLSDSGFDALQYAASYKDLAGLFGVDTDAATRHYLQFGRAEGRAIDTFDSLRYIASNADLIVAIGSDDDGGAAHYLRSGFAENRPMTSFDALKYAAANPDVAAAFGTDVEALTEHYIDFGYYEHRQIAPVAAMVEVIG